MGVSAIPRTCSRYTIVRIRLIRRDDPWGRTRISGGIVQESSRCRRLHHSAVVVVVGALGPELTACVEKERRDAGDDDGHDAQGGADRDGDGFGFGYGSGGCGSHGRDGGG